MNALPDPSDFTATALRDPEAFAAWLYRVRQAASTPRTTWLFWGLGPLVDAADRACDFAEAEVASLPAPSGRDVARAA